ncbi:hypothetical protein [uncultured Proteiniphilum sp.]|uniref:hypothetical protein n=1 Tax=uncultured Proteiniphilum sp. TaxID=497637 RepID=UPI00261C8259|nr:hypothetical protein [uncultured Proteiniphilum sp.]
MGINFVAVLKGNDHCSGCFYSAGRLSVVGSFKEKSKTTNFNEREKEEVKQTNA